MPKSEGEKGHRARHQLQPRRPRPRLYIPPAPRSSSSENSNSWYKDKDKKDKHHHDKDKDKDQTGDSNSELPRVEERERERRKPYHYRKKQIIYQDELCCILSETGGRCNELGVYKFNQFFEKMTIRKNLRLRADPRANHSFICGFHKKLIETAPYPKPNSTASTCSSNANADKVEEDEMGILNLKLKKPYKKSKSSHLKKEVQQRQKESKGKIDWGVLDMKTLEKYMAVFKLEAPPDVASKEDLIAMISRHFSTINVADHYQETISEFIFKVKVKKEDWSKVYEEGSAKAAKI